MSGAGRVASGATSLLFSTFTVMFLQLGYAAVTSRLLAPEAFGAYAAALAGVGLAAMLGGSGFGQAAARADPGNDSDRYLASAALLFGGLSAVVACAFAIPWSHLWGNPATAPVMMALALSIPIASVLSVVTGAMRRQGRTKTMAVLVAGGQVLGMSLGLLAVFFYRQPISLAVAGVAGPLAGLVLCGSLAGVSVHLGRPPKSSHADLIFGVKSTGMSLLRYIAYASPAWAMSRFVGAGAVGNYNRAISLIQVPAEGVQKAANTALFPELRPGGAVFRSQDAFTDIVALMTWATVVLIPLGMVGSGPLVTIVLGPGWEDAAEIAPWAALAGIIPFVLVPLMSAVEAQGRYRVLVLAWAFTVVSIAVGVIGTALTHAVLPAPIAVTVGELLAVVVFIANCRAHGELRLGWYWAHTYQVYLIQIPVVLALAGVLALVRGPLALVGSVAAVGLLEIAALWVLRNRLPPWALFSKYGVLPGRGRKRTSG